MLFVNRFCSHVILGIKWRETAHAISAFWPISFRDLYSCTSPHDSWHVWGSNLLMRLFVVLPREKGLQNQLRVFLTEASTRRKTYPFYNAIFCLCRWQEVALLRKDGKDNRPWFLRPSWSSTSSKKAAWTRLQGRSIRNFELDIYEEKCLNTLLDCMTRCVSFTDLCVSFCTTMYYSIASTTSFPISNKGLEAVSLNISCGQWLDDTLLVQLLPRHVI